MANSKKQISRIGADEAVELKPNTIYYFDPLNKEKAQKQLKLCCKKYNVKPQWFKSLGFGAFKFCPPKRYSKQKTVQPQGIQQGESSSDYIKRVSENNIELKTILASSEWAEVKNIGRYFGGEANFKDFFVSKDGDVVQIDYQNSNNCKKLNTYAAPSRGAMQVHLACPDGKGGFLRTCPPVYTLVADAFLPKPDGDIKKWAVIHKNGQWDDNRAENLEYVPRGNRTDKKVCHQNNTNNDEMTNKDKNPLLCHKIKTYIKEAINNSRNMKQVIRLTEGDLRRMIKNCVNEALNEFGDKEKGQRLLGAAQKRAYSNGDYRKEDEIRSYAYNQRIGKDNERQLANANQTGREAYFGYKMAPLSQRISRENYNDVMHNGWNTKR